MDNQPTPAPEAQQSPALAPPLGSAVSDRTRLLSLMAYCIGGWNVSKGITLGRLSEWDQHFGHDDEKLIRHMLDSHESDVTHTLKEEIKTLKARLFDLQPNNVSTTPH